MRLTKTEIARLRPGKRQFVWDAELRGFGVRVTEGAVSYVVDFTIAGKRRRVSLGGVGLMTLEKARTTAAGILLSARTGTDATMVDRSGQVTFREIWDRLRTEVDEKILAPATLASYSETRAACPRQARQTKHPGRHRRGHQVVRLFAQ